MTSPGGVCLVGARAAGAARDGWHVVCLGTSSACCCDDLALAGASNRVPGTPPAGLVQDGSTGVCWCAIVDQPRKKCACHQAGQHGQAALGCCFGVGVAGGPAACERHGLYCQLLTGMASLGWLGSTSTCGVHLDQPWGCVPLCSSQAAGGAACDGWHVTRPGSSSAYCCCSDISRNCVIALDSSLLTGPVGIAPGNGSRRHGGGAMASQAEGAAGRARQGRGVHGMVRPTRSVCWMGGGMVCVTRQSGAGLVAGARLALGAPLGFVKERLCGVHRWSLTSPSGCT